MAVRPALVALLMVVAAPAAASNLQFGWGNCVGEPASGWTLYLDCAGGGSAPAFATFQLDAPIANVVALEATIDLWMIDAPSVPPFWHLEPGGCNAGGIQVADVRGLAMSSPMDACLGASTAFQGPTGALTSTALTYSPGSGGANRARMLVEVSRPAANPAVLAGAPQLHFGWRLDWLTNAALENGGFCEGCRQNVALVLSKLVVAGPPEVGELAVILGTDPGSLPDLCLNPGTCLVVPVARSSWGRLKALYR